MKRLMPALTLSSLLVTPNYGVDWTINTTETKTIANQTINGVDLTQGGRLTVNSTGTSTINGMGMFFFNNGAGATFNVNNGTLNLDLSITNMNRASNDVVFNLASNSTLKLLSGVNGGTFGIFRGIGTNLTLKTAQGSNFVGTLINDERSNISLISGSTMSGDIIQNAGELDARIEGELQGSIVVEENVAQASLRANENQTPTKQTATINGGIIQGGGNLDIQMRGLYLKRGFTQTGGSSQGDFRVSRFDSAITISDATAQLDFKNSTLQSISTTGFNLATGGRNNIALFEGSTMDGFIGTNSRTTLSLNQNSVMQGATQSGGDLSLNAEESTIMGSVVGSNGAELNVTLDQSTLHGGISNSWTTNLDFSASEVGGDVIQTDGDLKLIANQTQIRGMISQTGGITQEISLNTSKVSQGIFLNGITPNVQNGQLYLLRFSGSEIDNGLSFEQTRGSVLRGEMSNTKITGGYRQTNGNFANEGRIQMKFLNASSLEGGVVVKNGNQPIADEFISADYRTVFTLDGGSTIRGGVISENHTTWIQLTESKVYDGIRISEGVGYFRGERNSLFDGNLISTNTRATRILLNNRTRFNGNIEQTKGWQNIGLFDSAEITGSVFNNNTQTLYESQSNSVLRGSYMQNEGSHILRIGGNSSIDGNVTYNNVRVTLENTREQTKTATIKGDFTQNGGTLSKGITGLTLEGVFTQNGGTANVFFNKANFHNPTTINNAVSSKVTFDEGSLLKDYTIVDSPKNNGQIVNLLKLDHVTILDGNFTLKHSASKLTVINDSRITGSIISNDPDNDLELDIGSGGTIGGDLEISGGNAGGDIEGGNIGGDIKLTDANTHFHFKDSTIAGSINITRGNTVMTLDNTSIGKGFEMTGRGNKDPSLVLTISNGSSIAQDLNFNNTDVYLGGSGEGNIIAGNLISTNSNLINTKAVAIDNLHPGKEPTFPLSVSGLTIEGEFRQEGGTLDFVMSNKSKVVGETSLNNSNQSHLFLDRASALGKLSVGNVSDALIFLNQESSQEWQGDGIILTDSKVILKAYDQSSFVSNVKVVSNNNFLSETKIFLQDQSRLVGDITQGSGTLLLGAQNFSEVRGNFNIKNLEAQIALNNNSKIFGDLLTHKSNVDVTLDNRSEMHSNIISTSTPLLNINANNGSTLVGNITHEGSANNGAFDLKMNFSNKSVLDNGTSIITGAMQIRSNNSTINSEGITLVHGRFDLSLDNRSNGVIKNIETGGTNTINVTTVTQSDSTIENLNISDTATLTLIANTGARISGNLLANKNTSATLASLGNATINFDITPLDNAILKVSLNGGKLMGRVIQNAPILGEVTLGTSGAFGGRWIMTDDSTLRSLTINNSPSIVQDQGAMFMDVENSPISMVDMTKDRDEAIVGRRIGKAMVGANVIPQDGQTRARTLSLGNLNGLNGVFRVYADIGAELSDKVTAQSGVGNHIVQVYYNPATYTTNLDGKYIVVAHIDDENTTANFVGGPTEIGNDRYETELEKVPTRGGGGWDWILGGVKNAGPSYGTKVIASILQSQYRSFVIQTETLNQRLGELRELNRIDGLWARYYMGVNGTKETNNHVKVDDHYYSGWIGYDQNTLSLRGQNFLGFALSYALINPDSKDYTGSIHNVGFNFYDVFVAKNDFYVDVVAKYIMSYGMYDINYYSLSKNSPKYFNHKFMVSAEIGKKFKLGQKRSNYFYLQPEVQITSGYILGNKLDFIDVSNTNIRATLGDTFPAIMRAGLTGAYAMEYSSFKGDIRLGTSLVYEVGTGGSVDLDDGNSVVQYKYGGDFHLLLQAGANFILNDSSRIYFEASTGFFGDTNTTYAINAGVRFNFGPKNTRRLKIPSSTPPPPPPKPEYDPRNIPVITDNTKTDIRNNNEVKRTPAYNSDYFINTRKNFRDSTSIKRQ